MYAKPLLPTRKAFFSCLAVFGLLAVCLCFLDFAAASGGITEFSSPLERVVNTITGPAGKWISIVAMALCGVIFIMNKDDISYVFKLLLSVVFGISFIAFAASIVNSVFSFSGAVTGNVIQANTPYVGFLYADSLNRQSAARQAKEAKEREWNSTTIDGQQADLSKLNFNYEVKGKTAWKPERVYDDGRQTFIEYDFTRNMEQSLDDIAEGKA